MARVTTVDVDVTELMGVAERVAREAGALVSDGRPDRVTVAATKSSPQDVVTAMDYASEELVRRRLAELRPDDGVLGEERGWQAGRSGVTWVVDPIDGTVNYLYGQPSYSVSVAAVTGPAGEAPDPRTWTVLASCVHAPAYGVTYTAGRGLGAFRDGVRLTIGAGPDDLSGCLVGTGFGYDADAVEALALERETVWDRIGSASFLTLNEKRVAAGYSPTSNGDTTTTE